MYTAGGLSGIGALLLSLSLWGFCEYLNTRLFPVHFFLSLISKNNEWMLKVKEQSNNLKVKFFVLRDSSSHMIQFFWKFVGSLGAKNEKSYSYLRPPALRAIAIPFCSSLPNFLWQCNWQASAVKTSNCSFFIWRHFVGFNQGFNWQAGSGWVAPRAGV